MDRKNSVKDKFPKKIKILGREWKIKQVKGLKENEVPLWGLCDYDDRIIFLEKDQMENAKFSVLVHEACHAWMILCGIDQKMNERETEVHCQLVAAFVEDVVRAFSEK